MCFTDSSVAIPFQLKIQDAEGISPDHAPSLLSAPSRFVAPGALGVVGVALVTLGASFFGLCFFGAS